MNETTASRASILLVEDIGWLRSSMRRTLEGYGFNVFEASDADEAIRVAACVRPDLILTEEQLPTFRALEQRVREHPELSSVPIVIVNPDAAEGARYGDAFVLTDFAHLGRLVHHPADTRTDF
ncbi:MAG: PleD family two-component system response regulator [Pyrinomonadaceae bacterium]